MSNETKQTNVMSKEYNAVDDFIEKWNVGYEDHEQKAEFAAEMKAEINQVTQDVAVKFAEFMDKGNYFRMSVQVWCHPVSLNEYTTTQLYAEFIKTL